jgi:hypothetical protein
MMQITLGFDTHEPLALWPNGRFHDFALTMFERVD